MKTKKFKNLTLGFTLFLAVLAMSSCNRGVGCPSEFSLDNQVSKTVIKVIETSAKTILK